MTCTYIDSATRDLLIRQMPKQDYDRFVCLDWEQQENWLMRLRKEDILDAMAMNKPREIAK